MDIFIEKMVAKKKDIYDYLIIIGALILGFVLMIGLTSLFKAFLPVPIVLAGVGYGIYLLIISRNIEFEYIVTNDELDIDKITAKRRRKRIFTASCKSFDIVARVDSEHFTDDIKEIKNVIKCVSSNNSPDVYFVRLNYKKQRTLLLFEPNERMLNSLKVYIPKKIYV